MIASEMPSKLNKTASAMFCRIFACEAAEIPNVTLHDLRHCYAQWSVDAGIAEAKVQVALRHASAEMTRRYSKQKATREVGNAIGEILTKAAM